MISASPGAGLYIHVPFCKKKCGYCDFYSFCADEETIDSYTALVCRMLRELPQGRQSFNTVYFGGGTPSLLGAGRISAILETAARYHTLSFDEVTLECNPATVDRAFFSEVKNAGVNRVSIGVQSGDSGQLRTLGRLHTARQAAGAVSSAQAAGISNISLDIMLALPGQTESELLSTINFCAGLFPRHISAYILKIEENTPFAQQNMGERCPDEDGAALLYLFAVKALSERGFFQYEISNFAVPGYESRHNLCYWQLSPYIGLGPAAHSFFGGRRRFFEPNLGALLAAENAFSLWQEDGAGGGADEYIMLRLRLSAGLSLSALLRLYEIEPSWILERARPFLQSGHAVLCGDVLSLTPEGFLLSNSIISSLIP